MLHEKHFSLQEAKSWLPESRRRFSRIHELYSELESLKDDYEKVQALIRANGHAPKETGFEPRVRELQELLTEIVQAGIQIKDIGRGLVDFPHVYHGDEVYLCWQLGENDIEFWHFIEDGFSGRTPL